MTRSVWKGPFYDAFLKKQKRNRWRIWSRRSVTLPEFVGCYAQIYNGKGFVGSKITEDMIGHKFGEFASTRKISKTEIKPKKKVR